MGVQGMSSRAPIDSPLTSQARADAQISNPATAITATAPLEPTAPVDPLKTSNPDNGGITKATAVTDKPQDFDVSSLVNGLKDFDIGVENAKIAGGASQGSNDLTTGYGIDLGGYTIDEANKFRDTASDPNDPNIVYAKIIKRKSNSGDKTLQSKFVRDIQGVDMDKKVANSGVGINPDIGLDRESTVDLANMMASYTAILGNRKLNDAGDITNFSNAFNEFKKVSATLGSIPYESRADAISGPLGALKAALSPLVNKTISIEMGKNNGIKTSLVYELENSQKGLKDYMKIHEASKEDLGNLILAYKKQDDLYDVSYGAITGKYGYQQKSQIAKQKLNASPIYKNFMETMAEIDPAMAPLMNKWKNDDVISPEETKYLKAHLLGEGQVKQMLDAHQKMMDDNVPGAYTAFKQFQSFIDIKNSLNDTMLDDIISTSKSIPSSMTLSSLSFNVNSGY